MRSAATSPGPWKSPAAFLVHLGRARAWSEGDFAAAGSAPRFRVSHTLRNFPPLPRAASQPSRLFDECRGPPLSNRPQPELGPLVVPPPGALLRYSPQFEGHDLGLCHLCGLPAQLGDGAGRFRFSVGTLATGIAHKRFEAVGIAGPRPALFWPPRVVGRTLMAVIVGPDGRRSGSLPARPGLNTAISPSNTAKKPFPTSPWCDAPSTLA